MRKVLLGLLIFVGLVAAAGAAALLLFDVNQFRGTIAAQIERRLHRQVTLGKMGLSLFPLAIKVDDFSIAESPAFPAGKPFLSAKNLYLRVELPALLRKQIRIESLRIEAPQLELVKDASGRWNFSDLGEASAGSQASPPLALEELRIDDASVGVTNLAARTPRTIYDHIDIALAHLVTGQPFQLTLKGRAYGTEASVESSGLWDPQTGVLTLSGLTAKTGGLTATGGGQLRTKPEPAVDVELKTDNAPLPELLKLAGAGNLVEAGAVSVALHAQGPTSDPAITGSGSVRGVKLKLASLTKPLEIDSAKIRLEKDAVTADEVTARLASTTLHGALTARNLADPRLEFRLNADHIDVAELQKLAETSPPAKTGSAPAKLPSGAGSIAIGSLTFNQVALTDVRAQCKLDGGILRLDPVSAKTFGGETQGAITVDLRPGPGAYGLRVALKSIDANQLLSATTSLKQIVSGLLAGSADLQVRPKPGQELARGLNGTVQVQLNNGRLAGVRVLDELASIARLLGYSQQQQPFTSILKLAGTLQIRDGVATTNDLQMVFDGGSLTAAGTLDLADQSIRMQLTSLLDKSVVPSVDRSQIGGMMSTVMANGKGQLVIPANVTGTLKAPKFQPDPERMAKLKLQGLSTPEGLAGTAGQILGAFGKKNPPPAGQTNKQPDPAQSILDMFQGLTKKKK